MPKRTNRSKTKAGQRRPVAKQRQELPIMPLVVGGVLVVTLIVLGVLFRIYSGGGSSIDTQPVANIHCDAGEQTAVHYHAHVDLIYNGTPATIPASIGITGSCFYWMHTHSTSGIIHIEAPKDSASRQFTVGDFFAVWRQPINSRQVATFTLHKGDQVKVWINGKPYTGKPANATLHSHDQVVIEVGSTFIDPPTFDWTDPNVVQEAGTAG